MRFTVLCFMILKCWENNSMAEINLVTSTPDLVRVKGCSVTSLQLIYRSLWCSFPVKVMRSLTWTAGRDLHFTPQLPRGHLTSCWAAKYYIPIITRGTVTVGHPIPSFLLWLISLTLKPQDHFFFQNIFYFLMLFIISTIFLYETGPIQGMFNQHCGYW